MAASMCLRVLELYSGLGGMHWALKESGIPFEVVTAIDINTTANRIYQHNFPGVKLLSSSIDKLTVPQFEGWNVDAILMSPPCQPFTRMGNKKDIEDIRAKSFLHVLHLVSEARKKPGYLLVENVKGFEVSEARDCLVETLTQCGYQFQEFLLTPLQVGVPNCRLRYYLIATTKPGGFSFQTGDKLVDILPQQVSDWLKYRTNESHCDNTHKSCHPLCHKSCDSIQTTPVQNGSVCCSRASEMALEDAGRDLHQVADGEHRFYEGCHRLDYFLEKQPCDFFKTFLLGDKDLIRFVIMDVVQPSHRKSACFTRRYGHFVEGAGSIVCMTKDPQALKSVSRLKSQVVDQPERSLLGEAELNLLRNLQLRYFTPREIANLLCFPPQFSFPCDLSTIQMYRCLGNSLNVHVVSLLICLMTS